MSVLLEKMSPKCKNDRKCRWYQNDQEGLKRGKKLVSVTWVVGLD